MRVLLVAVLLVAALVGGALSCGKKEDAPKPAVTAPSGAPASSEKKAESEQKPDEAKGSTFKGSYAAKQAEVRTPDDAPKFIHPDTKDSIGAGELALTLPATRGPIAGKASGALGAQVFSGWLEEGRVTGTLHPNDAAANAVWAVVDATLEGSVIKGVMRGSGRDGRVVRDAAFSLEKSK